MFKIILSNFHIEKIMWIIKSNILYMILSGLLLATATGVYGNLNHNYTYMATVSFYAYNNPDYITDSNVNQSANDINQAKYLLDSYMQILNSETFLSQVNANLDFSRTIKQLRDSIGAEAVDNTAVFKVYVFDDDPLCAMEIANVIGILAPSEIIRIVKSGGIEILDPATLPTEPYEATNVIKLAVFGAAGGFILAAVIFLLRGLLDTTVRRRYEIEDLFNIPIIGAVPDMIPKKKGEKADKILNENSSFAVKEAYSNIRASMMFMGRGQKCPIFAFTSADVHEGKSLTCYNVSKSFAQMGKKVLFIDADMRKSNIARMIGIENSNGNGLSQYLAEITEAPNLVHKEENLDVILSGKFPPNPSELLLNRRWQELLAASREVYDFIFIDLPPVGIVMDALTIVGDITAFVLVVREGFTKFDREEMIVRKLESVDANICGFIYNAISMKSPDYNYKSYGGEYEYK